MQNEQDMRDLLYEKMSNEQENFIEKLKHSSPEEIISSLNDSLSEGNESGMFCTAFLGILDLKTGLLKYCNAGHNPPLIIDTKGNVLPMRVEPNLPLGMFCGYPYEGQETRISRQMMLYMYTDGVNEAENKEKELFGDRRLISLLRLNASKTPTEIIDFHRSC